LDRLVLAKKRLSMEEVDLSAGVASSSAAAAVGGNAGLPLPEAQQAPLIPAPTAEDIFVAEARKKVVRALDARVTLQDEPTALAAIETALKLVSNIIDHPSEPKFRKVRANNAAVSKKLLRCPGGTDLMIALGFKTKVVEFEEFWVMESDGSVLQRTLAECATVLERYRELERIKLERNAKLRKERLANMNEDRARTLQAIEEDRAERRDRERMR
jgi:hypothetical protein